MTAEAAVLNRLGVALAADSAVTVTLGTEAQKIYASSDKLFQLSTCAPVGVLIYGNADFVGMPWETIIKTFRAHLSNSRFNSIQEYADEFLRYLSNNRSIISRATEKKQVDNLVEALFRHVRDQLADAIDEASEQQDGLEENDIPPIVTTVVRDRLRKIRDRPELESLGDRARTRIRQEVGGRIRKIRDIVFGTLPMTPTSRRRLTSIAVDMLARFYFGPSRAGLVVAGFGERDYMPVLVHYAVEGMVIGAPRARLLTRTQITDDYDAAVHAFAQQDSVQLFMEGIDASLAEFIKVSTNEVLEQVVSSIVGAVTTVDAALGSSLRKMMVRELPKVTQGLMTAWEAEKQRSWQPIVQIVAALPKDELASTAEALVNLTKFRRRVTPTSETVGGPVDVAVITKGDGFVWVSRKHYFDPTFNPRVMARYDREA